jgi:hypothetical protein
MANDTIQPLEGAVDQALIKIAENIKNCSNKEGFTERSIGSFKYRYKADLVTVDEEIRDIVTI